MDVTFLVLKDEINEDFLLLFTFEHFRAVVSHCQKVYIDPQLEITARNPTAFVGFSLP